MNMLARLHETSVLEVCSAYPLAYSMMPQVNDVRQRKNRYRTREEDPEASSVERQAPYLFKKSPSRRSKCIQSSIVNVIPPIYDNVPVLSPDSLAACTTPTDTQL